MDTLRGKPGEFRRNCVTNRRKSANTGGALKRYEYVHIRLGFLQRRSGPPCSQDVRAVGILFRYLDTERLEREETWGGRLFQVGSWCMMFGEVVDVVGLYRWHVTSDAVKAGATRALVDAWVERSCR